MPKKKLYEIKNGSITVYVECRGREFRFMGFTVYSVTD